MRMDALIPAGNPSHSGNTLHRSCYVRSRKLNAATPRLFAKRFFVINMTLQSCFILYIAHLDISAFFAKTTHTLSISHNTNAFISLTSK